MGEGAPMNNCPNCAADNPLDATTCSACGHDLGAAAPTTSGAVTPSTSGFPLGAVLAALGGAIAVAGCFGPWATGRIWLIGLGTSGLDLMDGAIVLAMAGIGIAAGLVALSKEAPRAAAGAIAAVAGLGAATLSVVDLVSLRTSVSDVLSLIDSMSGGLGGEEPPFTLSVGGGLWLVIGGAVMCTIGGILALRSAGGIGAVSRGPDKPLFLGSSAVVVVLLVLGLATGGSYSLDPSTFGDPLGARGRAQDKAAQSGLRNSLAAAKTIFTDTDDYSTVSVETMAMLEPSLEYVDASTGSTGPTVISIYTNGTTSYAAAALSDAGRCFYLMDDAFSGITYGEGPADACTGNAAAAGSVSAEGWAD